MVTVIKNVSNFIKKLIIVNLFKREKLTEKRQNWGTPLGSQPAFGCWLALKSNFKHCVSNVFLVFVWKINKKCLKSTKKVENGQTKEFHPAFRCGQYLTTCQNTQQLSGFGFFSYGCVDVFWCLLKRTCTSNVSKKLNAFLQSS